MGTGTGRKATAETVYRLGSSSKQFTAALVMKLVERGVVGLDDASAFVGLRKR